MVKSALVLDEEDQEEIPAGEGHLPQDVALSFAEVLGDIGAVKALRTLIIEGVNHGVLPDHRHGSGLT